MGLPPTWNRSRAAAALATLLIHLGLGFWLLMPRPEVRFPAPADERLIWLPVPDEPPPAPPPIDSELPPQRIAPITAVPLPLRAPVVPPAAPSDWSATARDVAKDMTAVPSYRRFGEVPKGPEERPKEQYPPSIWPKPLPRVGTTVKTPEGETIIWVSDHCYVSISSRSLTQAELHAARRGVRTCIIPLGKKEARDDLFDPIKRPPPPQEPGCDKEGVGQSCGR